MRNFDQAPRENQDIFDARAEKWKELQRRIRRIASKYIGQLNRPFDTLSTSKIITEIAMKKIRLEKLRSESDPPTLSDTEILEYVIQSMDKKYGFK